MIVTFLAKLKKYELFSWASLLQNGRSYMGIVFK